MKTVLVVIGAGISIYKTCYLVRMLKKHKYNVIITMTKNATKFITPLLFETLSQNMVITSTFKKTKNIIPQHTKLCSIVDIAVVAPATANLIAKIYAGLANDVVSTILLSLKNITPKIICPAMNHFMRINPATNRNIMWLTQNDYIVLEDQVGLLADNSSGLGRMVEVEKIFTEIIKY